MPDCQMGINEGIINILQIINVSSSTWYVDYFDMIFWWPWPSST